MSFIPSKMRIQKFVLVESGTYNPQYRRSFTTAENEGTAVDELRQRLGGRRVMGPGSLAGLAGQIVKMAPAPGAELKIDLNGWDCRRFLFMLSVDVFAQGSNLPNRQVITGFSENAEVSLQGTVDPQMRFTINNIVTLRPVTTIENGRRVTNLIPTDCSHVIANQGFQGLSRESEMRIDPYDVMGLMMVNQGMYSEQDDAPLYNYLSLNTKTPTKIQRKFSQSSSYLAGILKSFGDATAQYNSADANVPGGMDHATLCTSAQANVVGSSAASDSFMMAIRSVSPEGYLSNYFTLRDLSILHPGHPMDSYLQGETRAENHYDARSRYSKTVMGEESHRAGDSADWHGINIQTQFAAMISHGVPGLMMELFFTEIHFRATNETADGTILVELLVPPKTLEKFDSRRYVEIFEERIITVILNDACMNGQITFDFECRCDIITETWIDISVGGSDPMVFNTPTFCDSLMTPMLSEADNANMVASDMNSIVSDLVLGENMQNAGPHGVVSGYESSYDDSRNSRSNYSAPDRSSNTTPRIII